MKRKFIPLLLSGLLFITASCDLISVGGDEKTTTPTIDVFEESKFPFWLIIHVNNTKISHEITEDSKFILTDIEPKLDEYVFEGWYYDENYQEKFPFDYIDYNNKVDKLYAKYILKEKINLKIHYPNETKDFEIPLRETINLEKYELEYENIGFENWYYDQDFTIPVETKNLLANKELEIYAKYVDLPKMKVNINIGEEIIEKEIYKTKKINVKDYIEDSLEYYLEGWYYDSAFTVKANDILTVTENLSLYVNYVKRETTKITFKTFNNIIEEEAYIGTNLDLSQINTKITNYTFIGWYYDNEFTQSVETKIIKVTENLMLYAKYQENDKVKFVCDIYNETINDYETFEYKTLYIDEKISLSDLNNKFSSNNYMIEGWYTDKDYEHKILTDTEVLSFKDYEQVSLYPKLYCKLKLYANNELFSIEKIPYTKTLTFENIQKFYGEDFEVKTLSEENFILETHKDIYATGINYLNFDLYDSYQYEIENETVIITGYTGNNAIVKIPAYINDKPVVEIEAYVFGSSLVSVTIPSTVTTINAKAFNNCPKLIEVYNLSDAKFNSKTIPYIYANKNELSKISIYNKEYVLYKDNNITYLIGYLGIKPKLTLPLTINEENYKLYDYAFYDNKYINTLIIPEGISEISNYSFKDCHDLYRVVLPKTLKKIGKEAFANCFNLVEIYDMSDLNIVKGDTTNEGLGQYAINIYKTNTFSNRLQAFKTEEDRRYEFYVYSDNEKQYLLGINRRDSIYENIIFPELINEKTYEIYHHAFYNDKALLSVTFPDTLEIIGNGAFENCGNLKVVELNSIKSIGDFAFSKCYRISKITIPGSISFIGKYSFSNCTNLTSIEFEDGIKKIGEYALAGCSSLTEINLPTSLLSIGEGALNGTSKLSKLTLPFVGESRNSNTNYYLGYIFAGKSEDDANINLGLPNSLKELIITDDEIIENQALWKCSNLTKVTLINTKVIKTSAFGYCTKLKSLLFKTLVDTIEENAFYQCQINSLYTDEWNKLNEMYSMFQNFISTNCKINTYTPILKIDATILKNCFIEGNSLTPEEKDELVHQIEYILENGEILIVRENGKDLFKWKNYSYSIPIKTNADNIINTNGEFTLKVSVSNQGENFSYSEIITIEKQIIEEDNESSSLEEN